MSQAEGDSDQAVQYWEEVLEQSGDKKLVKNAQKAIAKLDKSAG